jgi:hypothetical protein
MKPEIVVAITMTKGSNLDCKWIMGVYQKNARTVSHQDGVQITLWMNVAVAGLTT